MVESRIGRHAICGIRFESIKVVACHDNRRFRWIVKYPGDAIGTEERYRTLFRERTTGDRGVDLIVAKVSLIRLQYNLMRGIIDNLINKWFAGDITEPVMSIV